MAARARIFAVVDRRPEAARINTTVTVIDDPEARERYMLQPAARSRHRAHRSLPRECRRSSPI